MATRTGARASARRLTDRIGGARGSVVLAAAVGGVVWAVIATGSSSPDVACTPAEGTVRDVSGDARRRPSIALAPGAVIAAWESAAGEPVQIARGALSPRGEVAWSEARDADDALGQRPQAAAGVDGTLAVAWRRPVGQEGGSVVVQVLGARADGDPPVVLSAPGTAPGAPDVAVTPSGRVVVAWHLTTGTDAGAVVASSRVWGSGWSAPVAIARDGGRAGEVHLAADPRGGVTAVWRSHDDRGDAIHASRLPPGTETWTRPATIGRAAGSPRREREQDEGAPRPAASRWGTIVTWPDRAGGGYSVLAATRPTGGEWRSPMRLDRGHQGPPGELPRAGGRKDSGPRVALDDRGRSVVVWSARTPDGTQVIASRGAAGAFTPPATLSEPGRAVANARVAMTDDGSTWVAWEAVAGTMVAIEGAVGSEAGTAWSGCRRLSAARHEVADPEVAARGELTLNAWTSTNRGTIQALSLEPGRRSP